MKISEALSLVSYAPVEEGTRLIQVVNEDGSEEPFLDFSEEAILFEAQQFHREMRRIFQYFGLEKEIERYQLEFISNLIRGYHWSVQYVSYIPYEKHESQTIYESRLLMCDLLMRECKEP